MKLIIAEKPSVMKKIVQAIEKGGGSRKKGYVVGEEHVYTHAVGHLLSNKMPVELDSKLKSWDLNLLPFNFGKIPYKIANGKEEQYNVCRKLLTDKRVDLVINACDPDREGEHIFRTIYETAGSKTKVLRMWIKEWTVRGIKNAYDKMIEGEKYDNLALSAKCRQDSDYYVGMNLTMGMTSKFSNDGVINVGRVQTPTLNMVVELERRIQNFVSKPFWEVYGDIQINDDILTAKYKNDKLDKNRFERKDWLDKLLSLLKPGEGVCSMKDEKIEKKYPWRLFSLSSLQTSMNIKHGFSLEKTLEIAQNLYEKHSLITYPRTDEERVSKGFAKQAKGVVQRLPIFQEHKEEILENGWNISKRVVGDDSDLGAHEAITPVIGDVDSSKINSLSNAEKAVYGAIVKRFLMNFYPAAEYEVVKAEFMQGDHSFSVSGKILKKQGWKKLDDTQDKDVILPYFSEGQKVDFSKFYSKEGKTNPPKRFTEGTLGDAMKNPSKYVDDKNEKEILKETGGIGTEATRAGIVKALKDRGYLKLSKKNIIPTDKGFYLIDTLPNAEMKSVSFTANLEDQLNSVSKGEIGYEDFMGEIHELNKNVIEDIKKAKGEKIGSPKSGGGEPICKCPNCGSDVLENKVAYSCSENCGVVIFINQLEKALGKKKISKTQAKQLLAKGKTKSKTKLKSKKTKKDYEAFLTYTFKKEDKYPNNVWITFD